jgi:hypothetical protein
VLAIWAGVVSPAASLAALADAGLLGEVDAGLLDDAEALGDADAGLLDDAEALGDADAGLLGDAGAFALAVALAGAAADALALDDGSSLLGVADGALLGLLAAAPLIEAANALRCVRTSCSFVLAVSSSVIAELLAAGFVFVVPLVPVVPGSVAPVVPDAPSNSVRIRSAAATSVLQLALPAAGDEVLPAAGDDDADFPSVARCRFSSATLVLAVPVSEAAGISFNAASA